MVTRYNRHTILPQFGEKGQQKLASSSVIVIGCGALGTHTLNGLVRAGVGNIKAVDRDFVEIHNLHRLAVLGEDDLGRPKAQVLKEKLRRVNSEVNIQAEIKDVNPTNIENLIQGADLVLDCTDNLVTRYLINDACVKHNIPWIYAAVVATYGMTMNILPGEGPCLRCLFPERPAPGTLPTCETAGILNTIPQAISSFQVTQAFKILLGAKKISTQLINLDIWSSDFTHTEVDKNDECPCCVEGKYQYLEARAGETVTTLCGREAVQVNPLKTDQVDLSSLGEKLTNLGKVERSEYLLKFITDKYELNIFKDGRAIIKGTGDQDKAKALYSRYVGD